MCQSRGSFPRVRQAAVELEEGVVDRRVVLGEVEVGAGEGGAPLARAVGGGGRGAHRRGQFGHAHGGRMLGALMPFWYIGSLVLSALWAVAGWHRPGAGLVVIAAALLILSVVMSVLLLVPINNRNKTWTPENRPADWKQQLHRWGRYHYLRVAVIIAAF
ncbi:DUF1772 domain-containing protein, partial [Streptomyces globisporus]|uniref:DUF1772 domain-containing protein n=1 Tax=Streptomyces globisporus TaxID=1908 RepID=UPI001F43D2AB